MATEPKMGFTGANGELIEFTWPDIELVAQAAEDKRYRDEAEVWLLSQGYLEPANPSNLYDLVDALGTEEALFCELAAAFAGEWEAVLAAAAEAGFTRHGAFMNALADVRTHVGATPKELPAPALTPFESGDSRAEGARYASFCPVCDAEVSATMREQRDEYCMRGHAFTAHASVLVCDACGEVIGEGAVEDENLKEAYATYDTLAAALDWERR